MKKRRSKGSLHSKRLRDYRYTDKKKGFKNDLTLEGVRALIALPCFYCGKKSSGGLDRLDCKKGHEMTNIVSACYKCNLILTTLPYQCKLELREGLRRIHEKDLLKDWEPVFMTPVQTKEKETPEQSREYEMEKLLTEERSEFEQKFEEEVRQKVKEAGEPVWLFGEPLLEEDFF